MFKFIRKPHSKGPAACHCAAGVPGGFSQPFLRLHHKGFTTPSHPKGTQHSVKTQGSRGAAWPSKRSQLFPGCLEGRAWTETFTPQFSSHGHFRPNREEASGAGAQEGAPLTESRISNLCKGVWEAEPRSGVWKKVLWAVLEFAWGLFNPQNPQKPHLARVATLWIRYPWPWKQRPRRNPLRGTEKPPLFVVSCPSEEMFCFCLDFA